MQLNSVRGDNGIIHTSQRERMMQLKYYWEPTFSKKPLNYELMPLVLQNITPLETDLMVQPGREDYGVQIELGKLSQPGPDGIPYLAYKVIKWFATIISGMWGIC